MPGNFKKEDLRIKKTYSSLVNALHSMLNHRNFNHITVNDLCEEALISRATFYVHFDDKYDLLGYWLLNVQPSIINNIYEYKKMETIVNQFIYKNQKVITNILKDSNNETLELVYDFVSSIVNFAIKRKVNNVSSHNQIILSNFCTGGLVNLLLLQVKKNFPSDITMMNSYLYELLKYIMDLNADNEQ